MRSSELLAPRRPSGMRRAPHTSVRPAEVALVLVLVASALAGCGSGAPPPPESAAREPAAATAVDSMASAARAEEDARVRAIVDAELEHLVAAISPSRAVVAVLDPRDGRVVCLAGRGPRGDDEALDAVPTASTLKPLTVAAALDAGFDPARRFSGEDGAWEVAGETLRDASPHRDLDAAEVLVHSSNIGAAKLAEEVGMGPIVGLLEAIHLGAAPLPGAEAGAVPPLEEWVGARGLRLAGGVGLTASPIAIAAGYGALANGGVAVAPTLDGTGARARVMRAETAAAVLAMLERAVGPEGTGHRAAVEGLRVAGKTGTHVEEGPDGPRTFAAFAGVVPADAPRFVVYVGVGMGGTEYYGGSVAAPAFGRIARGLAR